MTNNRIRTYRGHNIIGPINADERLNFFDGRHISNRWYVRNTTTGHLVSLKSEEYAKTYVDFLWRAR
jgi:hypothetical protein